MKGIFKLLLFAGFFILLVSTADAQDFTITNFHSDIQLNADGSYQVSETIEVRFHRQRHGIYREIPYIYIDELGDEMRTPLDVISVTKENGEEWETLIEYGSNTVYIRIGSPDYFVDGRQVYKITYLVENALLYFEDHDELYWNVTGNEWVASIENASATVHLPPGSSSKLKQGSCYTGAYGGNTGNCNFRKTEDGAEFYTTSILRGYEGFTIAFGYDKGITAMPTSWQRFIWWLNLRENWVFAIPIVLFFIMFIAWFLRGRDPKVRQALMVQYEPAKHDGKFLSPAESGTIIDEKLDSRDITAAIIGLAQQGYIKIKESTEKGDDYTLTKLEKSKEGLTKFEKDLLDDIFSSSDTKSLSSLKNKFYSNLPSLKKTIYKSLLDKNYFVKNPDTVRQKYLSYAVLLVIGGFIFSMIFCDGYEFKGIFAFVLAAIPVFVFGRIMPAKTRRGAEAYMDTLGFQEFMNRADKDMLERLGEKDLFYKFLGYAIALDVADQWAKAFEGIYMEPPDWYVPYHSYTAFHYASFARQVNNFGTNFSKAIYSAPRSSGSGGSSSGFSSGGGFSGGGFGGGGGGSW